MTHTINGGCVSIEFLVMGPIENNVYIVGDGDTTFVVDPTCDPDRILKALEERKLDTIVLTHFHWDHCGAAKKLRDITGARVIASRADAPIIAGEVKLDASHRSYEPCPVDRVVGDNEVVGIGAMRWKVLVTPGHTPGSMCLFLDAPAGSEAAPVLVSGDTLFAGAHGRTDFVGGDAAAMRESLKRLAALPDATIVLPGHGNPTTIAREKFWM